MISFQVTSTKNPCKSDAPLISVFCGRAGPFDLLNVLIMQTLIRWLQASHEGEKYFLSISL